MQTREEDFVSRSLSLDPHAGLFSPRSAGLQEKGLAAAGGPRRGARQALINILPLEQGERVTTSCRSPRRENLGQSRRDVRHHAGQRAAQQASDFVDGAPVRHHRHEARRGRRDRRRADLHERDDVHAHRPTAQCIGSRSRCACVQGRTSMGVRGIALGEGEQVDLALDPAPCDANADERASYLKRALAVRRGLNGVEPERPRPRSKRRKKQR